MTKYVYGFNEGNQYMEQELGQKGAGLAAMTKLGLPVPFGFTIGTEACLAYFDAQNRIPKDVQSQIDEQLAVLEDVMGKKLGDAKDPLLLSIRSGAEVSMPGILDTILNLGLNDETVQALARTTGDSWFAQDSYRRFLEMFGSMALGIPKKLFTDIFESSKQRRGIERDRDLDEATLRFLVSSYKNLILAKTGRAFPQDVHEQLRIAIGAVFSSWRGENAKLYRHLHHISGDLGTAVSVQRMAFGNLGEDSCTGVAFSRDPMTGEKKLFGEFLIGAQGEDVVAGLRTPKPIDEMKDLFPTAYEQLGEISVLLEEHYGDIQDIEFTVERGNLYILQTRSAKRTAQAAITAAVDMEEKGLIDRETALTRVEPKQLVQLLHPMFDPEELQHVKPIAGGLAASPGVASGGVYFDRASLEKAVNGGAKAILVRPTTTLDDLGSMVAADGILTQQGGVTCHAAVVARDMGKSCICGCEELKIDEVQKTVTIGDKTFHEGDFISIDGGTGHVYGTNIGVIRPRIEGDFLTIMKWADSTRTLGTRANAGTPREVRQAIAFGAEGIGLCRTEHMFMDGTRINLMREMILADDEVERRHVLADMLPMQTADFTEIFETMGEMPVAIRLLDPPLNELMPQNEREIALMSELYGWNYDDVARKIRLLWETNPMMGNRGCRLLISYPEICEMQTRAIINAALAVNQKQDINIVPEIMIPMVATEKELQFLRRIIDKTVEVVLLQWNETIEYKVGIMIETPRAALLADRLAPYVDFFSYGTNDLTQLSMGLSREDSAGIIRAYRNADVFEEDPFTTLDQEGVGQLIERSMDLARGVKPNMRFGICGEHGQDPASVAYFDALGMDYVSTSPYSLPLARLSAAQSDIRRRQKKEDS